MLKTRLVADGMLRENTPLEDYSKEFGLIVKREDKACVKPGPPFSKTRGVYVRVKSRPESIIGVLDTFHSQAGHAVARACQLLGKRCINFYPVYKKDKGLREPQIHSRNLGAELVGIPAGRSCILYHDARKRTEAVGGYIMPNALKLEESVTETAKEVPEEMKFNWVIIPSSSGTIAAGVIRGFAAQLAGPLPTFIVHLGYSRSEAAVRKYLEESSGFDVNDKLRVIDEGYSYKDIAKPGPTPPWPCNSYYDLKAFRWWMKIRSHFPGPCLFWNIG